MSSYQKQANSSPKKLVVEGNADREFFTSLTRSIANTRPIWIGPPQELGAGGNGKNNALNIFSDLLEELATGQITHLGIVLDADFKEVDQSQAGFANTLDTVKTILHNKDYSQSATQQAGLIFEHSSLPPVGIWVMPDNQNDGSLENFCITTAKQEELALITHAQQAINTLPQPARFPRHKIAKAEVATWLAWQREPGQGMNSLIGNTLLDTQHPDYVELVMWLKAVFFNFS